MTKKMVSILSTIGFVWRQENLRLRRDLELSRAMLSRQGDPETKFRGRFGAVSKGGGSGEIFF